ncbi:hypothetical protein Scep_017307 [Stephania cephalantha]|uniref:Uncharacterized protein n=1 Tax=Stephania cephalantha TaxID=152367 RepID=A0AAP0NUW1_9MAGN
MTFELCADSHENDSIQSQPGRYRYTLNASLAFYFSSLRVASCMIQGSHAYALEFSQSDSKFPAGCDWDDLKSLAMVEAPAAVALAVLAATIRSACGWFCVACFFPAIS